MVILASRTPRSESVNSCSPAHFQRRDTNHVQVSNLELAPKVSYVTEMQECVVLARLHIPLLSIPTRLRERVADGT